MRTILLALVLSLVALPAMAAIKFGSKVLVVKGFYEGCSGIVVDQEKDYNTNKMLLRVDLTCRDADGADRFVSASFKPSELEEQRFKLHQCDNKSCENK